MKVYVVIYGELYEGEGITKIFSNLELAKKYVEAELQKEYKYSETEWEGHVNYWYEFGYCNIYRKYEYYYKIEEFTLDAE